MSRHSAKMRVYGHCSMVICSSIAPGTAFIGWWKSSKLKPCLSVSRKKPKS